jgi:hypothetical protein
MLLLPRWPPRCSLDEAQAKAKEESSPSSSGSSSSSTYYNCLYRCAKLYSYAYDNSRRASLYSRRTADGLCSRTADGLCNHTYDDCCTCAISLCSSTCAISLCSGWNSLGNTMKRHSLTSGTVKWLTITSLIVSSCRLSWPWEILLRSC